MFDQPTSGLDWHAEMKPLYGADGQQVPSDIARAVTRSDTGEVIGIGGSTFKPVQHQDVLDPVLTTLRAEGYELIDRDPSKRDLYDLQGQKGAFVSSELAHNGAVLKSTIITGDFINPTGPSHYLPDGPPTLFQKFEILNSHNGCYAAQVGSSEVNVVCMNGMVSPNFSAVVKGKHTSGFSIDAFKNKVLRAAEMMQQDSERMSQYIRSPIQLDQAVEFLKGTLCKLAPKPTGEAHWSAPLLDEILAQFKRDGGRTVWDLYMAMTFWASHGDLRANATTLTARVGRDERIARSMRGREFTSLLAT